MDAVGAGAGGVVGAGGGAAGSVLTVSATGAVSGLSGAGISSGLAAIGGSMVGGIVVCTLGTAALTLAGGYGGYRLVKWLRGGRRKGDTAT
jgi:hypothetical protein